MNIVENPKIHKELFKRWDELEMSSADVIKDAEERGMIITPACISKYKNMIKNGNAKGSLTLLQLVFLCTRWGIFLNINVGTLTLEEGKPLYVIEKYNELSCLRKLHKVFPNSKVTIKDIS